MRVIFLHSAHWEKSSNFPPQCLHDSSGNPYQKIIKKIEYKENVELVHQKYRRL